MAPAKRVIVAIFDGLRPDLVTPELTPNLLRLAAQGTWFREARSVFPSVTRVAAASIGAGTTPAAHGIIGNSFLLTSLSRTKTFDSRYYKDVLAAETAAHGRLVTTTGLGDCLAACGRRLAIVHTGTAGATHFLNPRAADHGHWTFSIHGRDATTTPQAVADAAARLGPVLADRDVPRSGDITYATNVLVDYVLPTLDPDVALIWFSEPDTAFHYREIGSLTSLAALKHVDAQFGRVLDWVAAQPNAEEIAVIAASDHGHVTTIGQIPLNDLLTQAGFPAREGDLDGAVLATTGGNSGEIRVLDGDRRTIGRVAAWLLQQDFTGMLFARNRNEVEGEWPGTFGFDLVGIAHERAPDLFFILKSDEANDHYGLPGRCLFTDSVPLGGGLHGGLNRHELNTVLIVSAPQAAAAGAVTAAPASIIDIAPTALDLLGVPAAPSMTGTSLLDWRSWSDASTTFETGVDGFRQRVVMHGSTSRRIVDHGGRIG
jgi:phosphonoacetate hydrolase